MLPQKHIAVSTVIGAISWIATGELNVGLAALVAGVMPDIDHAADYAYYGWSKQHKLILPLHGYEYVLLGAVAATQTGSKVLWAATFSYLVHLLADQVENKTKVLGYSLLFRAWQHFRLEAISTVPEAAARGRDADLRMLQGFIQRWKR